VLLTCTVWRARLKMGCNLCDYCPLLPANRYMLFITRIEHCRTLQRLEFSLHCDFVPTVRVCR
jgi:hypothetical protein